MTRLLVTGGCGMVGANLVRAYLEGSDDRSAVVVDVSPPEPHSVDWFTRSSGRVQFVQADVSDVDAFARVSAPETITHVVHAAMVAHVPAWEVTSPRRYLDINIGGTVNLLEWVRRLPAMERLVYVSTGDVYGDPTAATTADPQSEDGPVAPRELYAISKLTSEQLARRYAELFGFDLRIARLSAVFGPMERATKGRTIMSTFHAMAAAMDASRPLRVRSRSLDAVADFVSAEDVADGLWRLASAKSAQLHHEIYNLAAGSLITVREVLEIARRTEPALTVDLVEAGPADVDRDPAARLARWNAYAIDRATADLGWSPRPLSDQIASYLAWSATEAGRATLVAPRALDTPRDDLESRR